MSNLSKKLVVVGLSGGVDSSVAAYLLKNQGYHVEAIFMQNWHDSSGDNCPVLQDLQDAVEVCKILKVKLHTVNFSSKYWEKVFQYFLDEYASGRTPNPDVLCNKEIKFRAFLDYAKSMGADFIATGHYARRITHNNRELLLKAVDLSKDQTYFLYLLDQNQLAATLFPLGEVAKTKVREIARDIGLPNYAKKDSTGICFIGERKFKTFLSEYLLDRPGDIVTTDFRVIGQHRGLMFYTYGQRQGIGIGGQKAGLEAPWYVAGKDLENNRLIVTQDKEYPTLMSKNLICSQLHWISGEFPEIPFKGHAKIRYRQQDQGCVITKIHDNNKVLVEFLDAQWAITPGQSVVFYDQEQCMGGGTILNAY